MIRRSFACLVLLACNGGAAVDAGANPDARCTITIQDQNTACSVEGKVCTLDCVPVPCGGYELLGPFIATCKRGYWSAQGSWDYYQTGRYVDLGCTIARPDAGVSCRDAVAAADSSGD